MKIELYSKTFTGLEVLEKIEECYVKYCSSANTTERAFLETKIGCFMELLGVKFDFMQHIRDIYILLGVPYKMDGKRTWRPNADGTWDADAPL